jgi:hypothetical protein
VEVSNGSHKLEAKYTTLACLLRMLPAAFRTVSTATVTAWSESLSRSGINQLAIVGMIQEAKATLRPTEFVKYIIKAFER